MAIGDLSNEPIEYREGDEVTTVRKLNGLTKYANVTLKWGITDSTELADWHQLIVDGATPLDAARRSVVIRAAGRSRRGQGGVRADQGLAVQVRPDRPERQGQRGRHRHPRAVQRGHQADPVSEEGYTEMFQTEVEFTLPKGYLDDEGALHRDGVMRLATAADEILPLKDPRVQQNPAYLTIIVLARVITRLGSVPIDQHQGRRGPVRLGPEPPAGALRAAQRRRRRRLDVRGRIRRGGRPPCPRRRRHRWGDRPVNPIPSTSCTRRWRSSPSTSTGRATS